MKEALSAVIDFGSGKIFGVVGLRRDNRIEIVGGDERVTEPDQVIKCGKVVDLEGLTQCTIELLEELEKQTDTSLPMASILVGGGFTRGRLYTTGHRIDPPKREINRSDIDLFLKSLERDIRGNEMTETKGVNDYRVLHLVPQEYVIDGEAHVRKNPEGMYGNTVEAKIHCLVALTNPLQNFIQCVKNARSSVDVIVPHSWGCGELLLSEEEKNLGCLLVDFGRGTTDYLLYIDGILVKTESIPVGGGFIDRDISHFLNTPASHAEEVKKKHGWCNFDALSGENHEKLSQLVQIFSVSWKPREEVSVGRIAEIVADRTRELFGSLIHDQLEKEFAISKHLGAGVIITGGSALLKGLNSLAEDIFKAPVRTGLPMRTGAVGKLTGLPKRFQQPAYSAGLGGLLLTLKDKKEPPSEHKWGGFGRLKQWITEVNKKW